MNLYTDESMSSKFRDMNCSFINSINIDMSFDQRMLYQPEFQFERHIQVEVHNSIYEPIAKLRMVSIQQSR